MNNIRIVVADQAEAILYDRATPTQRPTEVARIADPAAHLHNRDFSSDRPGEPTKASAARATPSSARTTRATAKP